MAGTKGWDEGLGRRVGVKGLGEVFGPSGGTKGFGPNSQSLVVSHIYITSISCLDGSTVRPRFPLVHAKRAICPQPRFSGTIFGKNVALMCHFSSVDFFLLGAIQVGGCRVYSKNPRKVLFRDLCDGAQVAPSKGYLAGNSDQSRVWAHFQDFRPGFHLRFGRLWTPTDPN